MVKKKCKCTYYIDDSQTEELTETLKEKDVGVIFDQDLKFDEHINTCCSKANKILGIIKRSFVNLNEETLPLLFKSLVRAHLEYANCVWSPLLKRQSILIERVQRRATKLIPNLRNQTYEQRLKALSLPSLKYRRLRGDLIQLYKIINKIDHVDYTQFFSFSPIIQTRGDEFKINISTFYQFFVTFPF